MLRKGFVPIIGLELHAQIASARKLFSPSPAVYGERPNSNLSPLDIGAPGALPRLNWECITMAAKTGLALGCQLHRDSRFDRKHYFYADLPLGYQITQQFRPLCTGGTVKVVLRNGEARTVNIERIHVEQDSGKLIHERDASMLDLNRAGSALMEIVSAPDMRSAEEAQAYVTKVARLLQFIGTCDADLSRGNLRIDVNVSVAREETIQESLGTRCEIKNLNSLVRMRDAIEHEVDRHIGLMNRGEDIARETRGWDTSRKETFSLRSKEAVVDYRFMRDADLPRVLLSEQDVREIQATLTETPAERIDRYQRVFGLESFDAEAMALEPAASRFFESAMSQGKRSAQNVCNWMTHELTGLLHGAGIFSLDQSPIRPNQIASIVDCIESGLATGKIGKRVLKVMFEHSENEDSCQTILEQKEWGVLRDEAILKEIAKKVVLEAPREVSLYRNGDSNKQNRMLKFFMGAAMKTSRGRADPEQMQTLVTKELNLKK